MQKNQKKKPPEPVKKPILEGSWHGADAWKLARTVCLSTLGVTVAYLILGLMLSFNSLWGRILASVMLVGAAGTYLYYSGLGAGQTDAAFAEIMYQRKQEGKEITKADHDRCFHPMKGFFAVLVGVAPYFLIALVFACLTQRQYYTVGALPSWITSMTRQSEFGAALSYYATSGGIAPMSILRIVVRAMTMPFINVAVLLGDVPALWAERLSPLLVYIAPLGYALGYRSGVAVRTQINTGIAIGDQKKKRRERRERKARNANRAPERLI